MPKVTKRKTKATTHKEMDINVPRGNGRIEYFKLVPALPKAGKPAKWKMTHLDPEGGKEKIVDDINIIFNKDSGWLQRQSEQCVLVFTIHKSRWSFAMGGTKNCIKRASKSHTDILHDIESTVSGNGKVLTLTAKNLGHSHEYVDFSFLASHTAKDGKCTIYQSKDPGMGVDRPK